MKKRNDNPLYPTELLLKLEHLMLLHFVLGGIVRNVFIIIHYKKTVFSIIIIRRVI